jgi:hypothetical protein
LICISKTDVAPAVVEETAVPLIVEEDEHPTSGIISIPGNGDPDKGSALNKFAEEIINPCADSRATALFEC